MITSRCWRTGTAASVGSAPSTSTWYSDFSPATPSETPTLPCASVSISSTSFSRSARPAARLTAVVVLPVPPFWLRIAIAARALARGTPRRRGRPCGTRASRSGCARRPRSPRSGTRRRAGTPARTRCTSSPCPYRSGIVGTGASFRRYSGGAWAHPGSHGTWWRPAMTRTRVASAIVDQLAAPDLAARVRVRRLAARSGDVSRAIAARLSRAPVVGCTTIGVLGARRRRRRRARWRARPLRRLAARRRRRRARAVEVGARAQPRRGARGGRSRSARRADALDPGAPRRAHDRRRPVRRTRRRSASARRPPRRRSAFVGGCAVDRARSDARGPYVWANGEVLGRRRRRGRCSTATCRSTS